MRRGFTLVELLVATGIFVLGFSVCLGLFLAGTRQRTAAEDHLRLGLAASSLVEEIGLGTTPSTTITKPSDYKTSPDDLLPVPHHPGAWYRVEHCQNAVITAASPEDDPLSEALLMHLLVVSWSTPSPTLTLTDINRRTRVVLGAGGLPNALSATEQQQVADYLVQRQLALRFETVVLRP